MILMIQDDETELQFPAIILVVHKTSQEPRSPPGSNLEPAFPAFLRSTYHWGGRI